MSETDAFFDTLESRILAKEMLGTMKPFLIDARDKFSKFESDAQAKNPKSQSKKLNLEIEALNAQIEAQSKNFAAEKERLLKEIETLKKDVSDYDIATCKQNARIAELAEEKRTAEEKQKDNELKRLREENESLKISLQKPRKNGEDNGAGRIDLPEDPMLILGLLEQVPYGRSITELSASLDIKESSVRRYILRFKQSGYVMAVFHQDSEDGNAW